MAAPDDARKAGACPRSRTRSARSKPAASPFLDEALLAVAGQSRRGQCLLFLEQRVVGLGEVETRLALHALRQGIGHAFEQADVDRHQVVVHVVLLDLHGAEVQRLPVLLDMPGVHVGVGVVIDLDVETAAACVRMMFLSSEYTALRSGMANVPALHAGLSTKGRVNYRLNH